MDRLANSWTWNIASITHQSEDGSTLLSTVFMSQSRALRLGKQIEHKIFVPQRVLIEAETKSGNPDHLVFWDVDVLGRRKDITRLRCRSRVDFLPDNEQTFFFGDWKSMAEGKSTNHLLV